MKAWTSLFTALGFLLGSIPFSYLVGRLFLSKDIRAFGDGNPGAINAGKAGGWKMGLLGGFLDYLKGAVPVGMANYIVGIEGWGLMPVALAPVLGHAFSPFLGFHGGKAIAVTFGIWSGLLTFEGPLALGLALAFFVALQDRDAWSTILGMLAFLVFLVVRGADRVYLAVWGGNMAVLLYRHRKDLRQRMHFRPYLLKALGRHG